VQTNNIPEFANAFVKRWQDFVATDMATFVDDLKGLIEKQRRDVQRTLLGLSSPYIKTPSKTILISLTNNLVLAISPPAI